MSSRRSQTSIQLPLPQGPAPPLRPGPRGGNSRHFGNERIAKLRPDRNNRRVLSKYDNHPPLPEEVVLLRAKAIIACLISYIEHASFTRWNSNPKTLHVAPLGQESCYTANKQASLARTFYLEHMTKLTSPNCGKLTCVSSSTLLPQAKAFPCSLAII